MIFVPTRLPVLLYVFSVLFLPGKAHWGHSYTVESSPASCCSFWSGACCFSSHWPTGSCRLVSGMLHGFQLQSLLLSFVTEPFQAVLSPPCPGQHQRSPPPAALARQGGIKSREVNGGWGRVQSGRAWESP